MDKKNMGQVFTPKDIVCEMLDKIEFTKKNIFTYKIMEPSFGDGAFLLQIIERIIRYGRFVGFDDEKILYVILNNVYGIEKDTIYYNKGIENIRQLLTFEGIEYNGEFPHLYNADTLEKFQEFENTFDIVIGNPPYVRIHNIENADIIKKLLFSGNGMTDLYIAFFDIGLKMLNKTGKLCFITPNSYFNSSAGKTMRKHFVDNGLLIGVKNFGHQQLFENATTYCCITTLDKNNKLKVISYEEPNKDDTLLDYNTFYINQCFHFTSNVDFRNIVTYNGASICTVKNGCATLMDKFFINSEIADGTAFSVPIIKASTGKEYKCFYPYDKLGNIIDIDVIKDVEPHTAKLLFDNKKSLEIRAIDSGGVWYGFGRSQAINDTYKKKFAINSLYKTVNDVRIYPCESGCAVYGGLYILTELSYEELKNILQSQAYIDYVTAIGKYKSGGYYTVNSKEVEKFINYFANKE